MRLVWLEPKRVWLQVDPLGSEVGSLEREPGFSRDFGLKPSHCKVVQAENRLDRRTR